MSAIPPPAAAAPVETEVKFHLPDLAAMRARLLKLGARSRGRHFERNIRFDDANQTLGRAHSLLRLRQDHQSTLTFKSLPADADPAFKQHIEVEVAVGDLDAMRRILESLGFHPQQVYEKWRESLVLERTLFCLDTLPFGDFLEIEASKTDIIQFAERLGLDWRTRILVSYLDIFDLIRTKQNLNGSDVTFGHFAARPVDLGPYLHFLEAGGSSER